MQWLMDSQYPLMQLQEIIHGLSILKVMLPGQFMQKIHYVIMEDKLNDALENAFIVAPKDTFPIQVGAFKNKSNADKIYKGIKDLTDIEVRIIVEEGLYKVRIARFPEGTKYDGNYMSCSFRSGKGDEEG